MADYIESEASVSRDDRKGKKKARAPVFSPSKKYKPPAEAKGPVNCVIMIHGDPEVNGVVKLVIPANAHRLPKFAMKSR